MQFLQRKSTCLCSSVCLCVTWVAFLGARHPLNISLSHIFLQTLYSSLTPFTLPHTQHMHDTIHTHSCYFNTHIHYLTFIFIIIKHYPQFYINFSILNFSPPPNTIITFSTTHLFLFYFINK
ncbi:hypothetical protein CsSME_00000727 [Camellia sinensis var. sinensis]